MKTPLEVDRFWIQFRSCHWGPALDEARVAAICVPILHGCTDEEVCKVVQEIGRRSRLPDHFAIDLDTVQSYRNRLSRRVKEKGVLERHGLLPTARIPLYLLTYRRILMQYTYHMLPQYLQRDIRFVVAEDEAELYRDFRGAVLVCPVQGQVSKVREWIINYARGQGETLIGLLDDDFTGLFFTPPPSVTAQQRQDSGYVPPNYPAVALTWRKTWAWIHKILNTTPLAGLAMMGMRFPGEADEIRPGGLWGNQFFNLDLLPQNLDWQLQYNEDVYLLLQLIDKGLPPVLSQRYRFSTIDQGSQGGCRAAGRTLRKHNESIQRLAELYPKYVTVKRDNTDKLHPRIAYKKMWTDRST